MPRRLLVLILAGWSCLACSKQADLPPDDKERWERIIENDTLLVESHPNSSGAYVQRGQHYFSRGQFDNALEDFTKAIEINPNRGDVYMFRGKVYMQEEMYDHALADYDRHLELVPDSNFGYFRRALCHFRLGKRELALRDYDKQIILSSKREISLDPANMHAQLDRCCVNYWAGNLEAAIDDCKEVCARGGVYGPKFSCDWAEEMEQKMKTGKKGKNICMMPACPSYGPRQLGFLFLLKFKIWSKPYP